jgi:hypothetical protein
MLLVPARRSFHAFVVHRLSTRALSLSHLHFHSRYLNNMLIASEWKSKSIHRRRLKYELNNRTRHTAAAAAAAAAASNNNKVIGI